MDEENQESKYLLYLAISIPLLITWWLRVQTKKCFSVRSLNILTLSSSWDMSTTWVNSLLSLPRHVPQIIYSISILKLRQWCHNGNAAEYLDKNSAVTRTDRLRLVSLFWLVFNFLRHLSRLYKWRTLWLIYIPRTLSMAIWNRWEPIINIIHTKPLISLLRVTF